MEPEVEPPTDTRNWRGDGDGVRVVLAALSARLEALPATRHARCVQVATGHGAARHGEARHDTDDATRHSTARHDKARQDTTRHDTARNLARCLVSFSTERPRVEGKPRDLAER